MQIEITTSNYTKYYFKKLKEDDIYVIKYSDRDYCYDLYNPITKKTYITGLSFKESVMALHGTGHIAILPVFELDDCNKTTTPSDEV